jgi:putative PEP-CTERM system histidine kinase
LYENSVLVEKTSTLELEDKPDYIEASADFVKTMLKENWIFAPNSRISTLTDNNNQLPDWIKQNRSIWMVAPLVVQMKLIGFVIIKRPTNSTDLTYEDRDLMTNVSTQLANQIRLQQQEATITQAKQLETYNRMSAFIMHDTNNVIAQLALIVKNAQRHKTNPAFIDDMISTVDNSVNRMKGLVQKFNPNSVSKPEQIKASDIVNSVIDATSDKKPKAHAEILEDFDLYIDKQKLILAIKNIVRNAQEASDDSGTVEIRLENRKISISDSGTGMDEAFIKEKLFHPFSTTKSENGIGIGAYLTKSYIEEIGALLLVSSEQNIGSTFTIQFPGDKNSG